MKISDDTKNIVNFLNETLEGNLQKPSDLEVLLEVGANYGLFDEFNQILLISSSFYNINSSLERHSGEDFSNIEYLEKEKIRLFYELQDLLKSYIGMEDEVVNDRFNKLYFGEGQGKFANILDLCHDLSALNDIRKNLKENQI